jgi:hypothetical protein
MTVKEVAEYLLQNYPHDAPVLMVGGTERDVALGYFFPFTTNDASLRRAVPTSYIAEGFCPYRVEWEYQPFPPIDAEKAINAVVICG